MPESTLRFLKPDAYRIVEPQTVQLIRRTFTEIAVDVYELDGTLVSEGDLVEISDNAWTGQPAAIALPDGWWCTLDPADGFAPASLILWKPGEATRVYTAAGPMTWMPLWDPVLQRLVWAEFEGAGFGAAYEWSIRTASLRGFPAAPPGGTLTTPSFAWPAGTGATRTSIQAYPGGIGSCWLDSEFVSLETPLQLNYSIGAPSGEYRHVRIPRTGHAGAGLEEERPTPDPANVFVLPLGPSGIPLAWMDLDGGAVGGIEGTPSGLRTIDADGLWGDEVWTAALSAGEYITGIHQRAGDGRWAVVTDDGSTSRVYLGAAGASPGQAFEVAGINYRGVRLT